MFQVVQYKLNGACVGVDITVIGGSLHRMANPHEYVGDFDQVESEISTVLTRRGIISQHYKQRVVV